MKNIGRTSSLMHNDGVATVFPSIDHLELFSLPGLKEIWDGPISSNSFQNLKELLLIDLPALKQFWKSSSIRQLSTVNCLPQLQVLNVKNCEMMEHVFLWNEEEEYQNKNNSESTITIMFPKLKKVELKSLPNLISLCQGIEGIEFPLLTEMCIFLCPNVTSMVSNKNNSGGSNNHHFFCQPEKVSFGNNLKELEIDWNLFSCGHKIDVSLFILLEKLDIYLCKGNMSLFSSSIAMNLVSLRALRISSCDELVQVIKDDEEKAVSAAAQRTTLLFPKLQKLRLWGLPKLVSFCEWKCDVELPSLRELRIHECPNMKNFSSGSLEDLPALKQLWKSSISPVFHKLLSIHISYCHSLRNLGKLSIAGKDCLSQLEILKIEKCEMMEQVFLWNEEDQNINNSESTKTKMFPKLNKVELLELPNLVTFCCQRIEGIEFPLLTTMSIVECPKMTSMVSSNENNSGGSRNADIGDHRSLHLFCQPEKVSFGNLKELRIHHRNPFSCGHKIHVSLFSGLEKLYISWCEGSMSLFSPSIARDLVSLRELSIEFCDELVHMIKDDEEEKVMSGGQRTLLFPKLQQLQLENLPKFVSFCEWKCEVELPSLRELRIHECPNMKISPVFHKLLSIHISCCHRLRNLGQLSIGGKDCLSQLEVLKIEKCERMEQVFLWKEEDKQRNIDTTLEFSKLKCLSLKSSPKLSSLCNGIESFKFPQLADQIQVEDCPVLLQNVISINLFCKPNKVKMVHWNNQPFRNAEYLSLEGDSSRNLDFRVVQNMRWLTFTECSTGTKLVNVTTMDTLFPHLEVLRIVKLTELEEIWDINDGPIPSNSFQNLKELRLEFLTALKHLWQSSSSQSQMNAVSIFSKLSSLHIYGCHELRNLFSLPVTETDSCLLQLEELVIESCDKMEHVFFFNEGENKSNIQIPKLKVLILDSLPKLTDFCKGIERFEFPLPDRKRISRCPLLNNIVSTDWSPDDDDDYIHLLCKSENKEKMELKLQRNITLGRNRIQECVEYMSFEGDGSTSLDLGVGQSMRCLTFREFSMGTKLMNMTTIATLFPLIKVLCLVNIAELEEIWDIDGPKNLNELKLKSLPALKHLSPNSSSPSRLNIVSIFNQLSSIYIYECHKLCNLFPLLMMERGSCVIQLERLVIGSCKMMEQVFSWNVEENQSQRSIHIPLVFPKLKVLKLNSLPRLTSFCEGTESFEFPLLVEMRISSCPLLQNLVSHLFCKSDKVSSRLNVVSIFNKLSSICIYGCHKLCHLFPLSMMESGSCLLQLERLVIESCDMMEQVFLWNEEKNILVQKFPKLKFLSLSFLPELKNLCKGIEHIQCPLLDQVNIVNCPKLKNIVYWHQEHTFIFNSLRSAQLQTSKGANTALQVPRLKREEEDLKPNEVMWESFQRQHNSVDGSYSDDKSARIDTDVLTRAQDMSAVFLETPGISKKNRIFGLGSRSRSMSAASVFSAAPPQYDTQAANSELRAKMTVQEELLQTQQEQIRQLRKMVQQFEHQQQEMMQHAALFKQMQTQTQFMEKPPPPQNEMEGEQSKLIRKTAREDEEEGRKGEIEEQNWKTTTEGGRTCEIEEEQN